MILDAQGQDYLLQEELKKVADSMLLKDGDITLVPTGVESGKDYLMQLAMGDRYSRTPSDQLERGLEHIVYFWIGKVNGDRGGIVFISHLENLDWWTLDAYKDTNVDNRIGDFSYRAGRLVIDWFFKYVQKDRLYTIHRRANQGATKMCMRLGFEEHKGNPEFISLFLRREVWDLKQ